MPLKHRIRFFIYLHYNCANFHLRRILSLPPSFFDGGCFLHLKHPRLLLFFQKIKEILQERNKKVPRKEGGKAKAKKSLSNEASFRNIPDAGIMTTILRIFIPFLKLNPLLSCCPNTNIDIRAVPPYWNLRDSRKILQAILLAHVTHKSERQWEQGKTDREKGRRIGKNRGVSRAWRLANFGVRNGSLSPSLRNEWDLKWEGKFI